MLERLVCWILAGALPDLRSVETYGAQRFD